MNIVFRANESDTLEYMRGIGQCLSYAGHNVIEWRESKPAFDMFDEIKPDLLIVDDINYPKKPLQENPQTKVAVVCEHRYFDDFADVVISTKVDTPFFFLPKAANQFKFISPKYNKMFECDVLYIGISHPIITKICSIENKLKVKIFGEPVGNEFYCGYISEKLIGDAFKTANTVIHLHETECSQQLFDALYCGASVISDISETTEFLFPDLEYLPDDDFIVPKLYQRKLSEETKDFSKDIIENHTYFDRTIELLTKLYIDHKEIENAKQRFFQHFGQ